MTDYKAMTPGDFLSAVGMSGEKWNEAYWQIWPNGCDDRETMFGWFCNAIMAGYDHAERKSEAARTALPGLVEEVERLRKALEPFANLGVSSGPDYEPCSIPYRITRGSIRNARAALNGEQKQ